MAKVLVTGASGQLGQELTLALMTRGHSVIAASSQDLDITNDACVNGAVCDTRVDAVINAAAYTDVDGAEGDIETANAVNAIGPKFLAQSCKSAGIPLLHVSTDFVFGQNTGKPHRESDPPSPENAYAKTKLAGENYIRKSGCRYAIVRTSWLFGRFGGHFQELVLKLASKNDEIKIVADELSAPTPSRALAETLVLMLEQMTTTSAYIEGIYHFCGRPYCTRADQARVILSRARALNKLDHVVIVRDVPGSTFDTPAKRPPDSRLDTARIEKQLHIAMPDWTAYIDEALKGPDKDDE